MQYPIRLATKDEYDRIGRLYEKAFDHTEGVLKYYSGFKDYLSFFVDVNNAFVIEVDNTIRTV